MPSWSEVESEAPELAARAKEFLDAHTHLTLATLRRDGSPRISGTEIVWRDGDLYIGSMWRAVKARDLIRDPRFALHSGSEDPDDGWQGDAKVAGGAEELSEGEIKEVFPEVGERAYAQLPARRDRASRRRAGRAPRAHGDRLLARGPGLSSRKR